MYMQVHGLWVDFVVKHQKSNGWSIIGLAIEMFQVNAQLIPVAYEYKKLYLHPLHPAL